MDRLYYHVTNKCHCCNRYDQTLIGGESHAWKFSFHATDTIRSFADWKQALEKDGYVIDEDGTYYSATQFIAIVEATKDRKLTHAIYDHTFVDSEGWDFTESNFA